MRPPHIEAIFEGDAAVDALVFEFMGLVMLALCVIVIAVPCQGAPSRRSRHH